MSLFKITYIYLYPESDHEDNIEYVIADTFSEAQDKCEKKYKGEYEHAKVLKIEKLTDDLCQ